MSDPGMMLAYELADRKNCWVGEVLTKSYVEVCGWIAYYKVKNDGNT